MTLWIAPGDGWSSHQNKQLPEHSPTSMCDTIDFLKSPSLPPVQLRLRESNPASSPWILAHTKNIRSRSATFLMGDRFIQLPSPFGEIFNERDTIRSIKNLGKLSVCPTCQLRFWSRKSWTRFHSYRRFTHLVFMKARRKNTKLRRNNVQEAKGPNRRMGLFVGNQGKRVPIKSQKTVSTIIRKSVCIHVSKLFPPLQSSTTLSAPTKQNWCLNLSEW